MQEVKWITRQINLLWQEVKKTRSSEKALSDITKIVVLMEVLGRKNIIEETITNEKQLIEKVTKKIKSEIPELKDFKGW